KPQHHRQRWLRSRFPDALDAILALRDDAAYIFERLSPETDFQTTSLPRQPHSAAGLRENPAPEKRPALVGVLSYSATQYQLSHRLVSKHGVPKPNNPQASLQIDPRKSVYILPLRPHSFQLPAPPSPKALWKTPSRDSLDRSELGWPSVWPNS